MWAARAEPLHRFCLKGLQLRLLRPEARSCLNSVLLPPQAWLWRVEGQDLFFERGLPLRFKVQAVRFHAVPTLAEQQAQVRALPGIGLTPP